MPVFYDGQNSKLNNRTSLERQPLECADITVAYETGMLVECCKKSGILVAFLKSAIFSQQPVCVTDCWLFCFKKMES